MKSRKFPGLHPGYKTFSALQLSNEIRNDLECSSQVKAFTVFRSMSYAEACAIEWPITAAALRRVARQYEEDARREDEEAKARALR